MEHSKILSDINLCRAYGVGCSHIAYGWYPTPSKSYTPEQLKAFEQGVSDMQAGQGNHEIQLKAGTAIGTEYAN